MSSARATLRSVKRDPAFWEILDRAVGAGPFDGGCLICARALHSVFGGRIVHLARNGRPDHYGVQVHGWLMDFDGPSPTPGSWIDRFVEAEVVTGVVAFRPSFEASDDIPDDPAAAARLAQLIRTHRAMVTHSKAFGHGVVGPASPSTMDA